MGLYVFCLFSKSKRFYIYTRKREKIPYYIHKQSELRKAGGNDILIYGLFVWLVAGYWLWSDLNEKYCRVLTDLFQEKTIVDWWLISETNMTLASSLGLLDLQLASPHRPRPHQTMAMAWWPHPVLVGRHGFLLALQGFLCTYSRHLPNGATLLVHELYSILSPPNPNEKQEVTVLQLEPAKRQEGTGSHAHHSTPLHSTPLHWQFSA
jgi:hypothetical protein